MSLSRPKPRRPEAPPTRAAQVRPKWRPAVEAVAICHVALGNREDMRRAFARLVQLDEPKSDVLEQFRIHNPVWAEDIEKALAAARAMSR